MSKLQDSLKAAEERVAKATPGPWRARAARDEIEYISVRDKSDHEVCWVTHEGDTEPTAELIAHAPTDIATLIAVVKELRAACEFYANALNVDEETCAHGKVVREPNTPDSPGEAHFEADIGDIAKAALKRADELVEKI